MPLAKDLDLLVASVKEPAALMTCKIHKEPFEDDGGRETSPRPLPSLVSALRERLLAEGDEAPEELFDRAQSLASAR
jgi:hypothetical protein